MGDRHLPHKLGAITSGCMEKEDSKTKQEPIRLFMEMGSGGVAPCRLGVLLQWLLLPLAKVKARWCVTVVQDLPSPVWVTV